MAYTEGQIDRLRLKLCEYRAQKGANGRMRPWKAIIDDILMSDVTQHFYPEDGSNPEFKEEALRRFAAGTSVPSQDKLEDIQDFLIEQKFLRGEELTNGVWDYSAALSLRNLFGEAAEGCGYFEKLSGQYRAESETGYKGLEGFTRFDMDFNPIDHEAMFEIAQQSFTWLYDRVPDEEIQKKYGDQIKVQKGYAFPSQSRELTIFLKDGLTGKTDIYLVTDMNAGQPVEWFQAAPVGCSVNFKPKLPDQALEKHALDKWLYRARPDAEMAKGE